MNTIRFAGKTGIVLTLVMWATGCIVAPGPHEGYYDHDLHRYYSGGGWHDCGDHDDHCR